MRVERNWKSFDFVLLALVCILSFFGIIILTSAYPSLANQQKIYLATGIILLFAASFIDYNFICKFYIPIYVVNIILLVAVFAFGTEANEITNTDRWLNLFGFKLQPSEFSKVFLILFLATFIDKNNDKINNILVLLQPLALAFVPIALILIQPALSASLVCLVILLSILFIANISYKYIMAVFGVLIPFITFFYYDLIYNDLNFISTLLGGFLQKYHFERIIAFVEKEPSADKYRQTYDSIVAIATGGLSGKGLYKGELNNLGFIYNNQNDFIFSVIGEELGYIGCVAVVVVMFLIIVKFFLIANRTSSNLGKLIVAGVIGMFAFQSFINVAVATGIMVNTGMPFPFLSQGGTSMWVNMICVGLVINVGMEKPKSIFEG